MMYLIYKQKHDQRMIPPEQVLSRRIPPFLGKTPSREFLP